MATKLKNLKVTKVDFVDEGANPDAHIRLFKSRDETMPREGQKENKHPGVLKRLITFIAKAAGLEAEEIDAVVEEVEKGGSESFSDRLNEVRNRKIADEIWDICFALQTALCSVLNDSELDGAEVLSAMKESAEEFHTAIQDSIQQWADGREAGIIKKDAAISMEELEVMKSAKERLSDAIEKACATEETKNDQDVKGEEEMGMKIDKSRMSPAELAFYESIEKRYGTEDSQDAAGGEQQMRALEATVAKSAVQQQGAGNGILLVVSEGQEGVEPETASASDNIYKGIHPEVKAELEELKKFRKAAEEKELTEIAKRYAIIGKKAEELVPMLKGLKAAGGSAYEDMIAVLDQAVDTVEKSGLFSEIGKSGHGSGAEGAVETQIDAIAKGYMKEDVSMDYTAAVAKAWEDHPELMSQYEEEAGF